MFGRKVQNTCREMRDLFSPYLDDRLDPVERDRMLYHVEICPACRHELSTLQETVRLLRRMPAVFPSRSFTFDVMPRRSAFLGRYSLSGVGLRMATAAALMVLFASLAIGFIGVFDESSPVERTVAGNPEAPLNLSTPEAEVPAGEVISAAPTISAEEGSAPPEAAQPNTSSGLFIGADQAGTIPDAGAAENAPPEATQRTREFTSVSPSWIRWMQIAGGAVVAVLISINVVAWRRRRW